MSPISIPFYYSCLSFTYATIRPQRDFTNIMHRIHFRLSNNFEFCWKLLKNKVLRENVMASQVEFLLNFNFFDGRISKLRNFKNLYLLDVLK